jgi:hypothetical protein
MREELRLRVESPNRFIKLDHIEADASQGVDIATYIGRAAGSFELKAYEVRERLDYWQTLELVLLTEAHELVLPTLFVQKSERNQEHIKYCFEQYTKRE